MNALRRQYVAALLQRMHTNHPNVAISAATTLSSSQRSPLQHQHSAATWLLQHCCHRTFSLSAARAARSHYDILGITPKATQADIKSSYYRLSMIYHPDKSPGNADAVEKFRAITAAYEVLSNYRLRQMYDKGIGSSVAPGPRSAYGHHAPDATVYDADDEPEDAQTRFYKRHMTRTEAPHASGRSPIYNYDAWTEAHYGQTFERRQAAQKKYHTKQRDIRLEREGFQSEMVVFAVLFGFMGMLVVSYLVTSASEDRVVVSPKKAKPTN